MLELKKKLMKNPQHIKNILKKYQFHNITISSKEIRCGIDQYGNHTSIQIKLNEKLSANDWVRDIHGDLFSLIMKCRNVDLKDIIQTVKNELGLSYVEFQKNRKIFGGFYDNLKFRNKNIAEIKRYENDILEPFVNKYNIIFFKDGIGFKTQRKFNIGVDHTTSRITVPWYDYEGYLVGIEGRYMGDYKMDEVAKWFPICKFSKSQYLFGYNINYPYLQSCEEVYVGESSKFVMQLDSMGINTAVAVGGNSIHNQQIKQLNWLNPKKIIICFDEGLEEELTKRQAEKMKTLLKFMEIKIGYVIDRENKYLEKNSKNSPSDLGKTVFDNLIRYCVVWI